MIRREPKAPAGLVAAMAVQGTVLGTYGAQGVSADDLFAAAAKIYGAELATTLLSDPPTAALLLPGVLRLNRHLIPPGADLGLDPPPAPVDPGAPVDLEAVPASSPAVDTHLDTPIGSSP